MAKRGLAAIIVACDESFSMPRDYLTGGVQITGGLVMKKQGEAPVIFANPMEIEEAAKTGVKVTSFNELDWPGMVERHGGDRTKAEVEFWGACLHHIGVESGKVGIYGVSELNLIIELVRLLEKAYPQYEFAGEMGLTLFDEAATTKDEEEIARMRTVAAKTSEVLEATWNYIGSQHTDGETLKKSDNTPLTIGDVRSFVRKALLDRGLEDTGMIFAQGRDGGFPHSRGEDHMELHLGQAIVFDLFPREVGGGYFHDVTRTWCLGYAPDEVQSAYEQVMEAFDRSIEMLKPGMPTKDIQIAVQDYFEANGHPTTRNTPGAMSGYVHGLGHGVGMEIHERPSMNHMAKDTLQVGNVVTIEPGLYYPDLGYGVRIEDTVYLNPNGEVETLTNFHKTLVLPIN